MIRVVFFGTPDFALPVLEALLKADDVEVVGVVTQPDRPSGRDHELTSPPVKTVGARHAVPVHQFASLKKPEVVETLKKFEADVFVVFSYGKIIPAEVLAIPRLGCLNVHPSLLPAYRGPTPVPAAILNGDQTTGVSIMLLDAGMDSGPILSQTAINVHPDDTTPTLMHRLIVEVGAPLLVATLRGYIEGKIKPLAQDQAKATFCKLLDREDGFIRGTESPQQIDRLIRAFTPWPGAYVVIEHQGAPLRVKILQAKLTDGQLEFLQVQPEGGRAMSYDDFKRGHGALLLT